MHKYKTYRYEYKIVRMKKIVNIKNTNHNPMELCTTRVCYEKLVVLVSFYAAILYVCGVFSYFYNLLQYSRGGPIIAFQIENEYGGFSDDATHLKALKNVSWLIYVTVTMNNYDAGCI